MPLGGKQVIKILQNHGFELARQKGSHAVMRKIIDGNKRVAIVPVHKELKKGTLRSIARQSGIDSTNFGV